MGAHDVASGLAPYLGGWTWQAIYAAAVESVLVVNGSLWLLGTAQRRLGTRRPVAAAAERAAFAAYIVQGPVLLGLAVALRAMPVPALEQYVLVEGAPGNKHCFTSNLQTNLLPHPLSQKAVLDRRAIWPVTPSSVPEDVRDPSRRSRIFLSDHL